MAELKILSRTKLINGQLHESRLIVLNAANLRAYFSYPLNIAARDLGVCSTALKRYGRHNSDTPICPEPTFLFPLFQNITHIEQISAHVEKSESKTGRIARYICLQRVSTLTMHPTIVGQKQKVIQR
jgi:hypothetical protein